MIKYFWIIEDILLTKPNKYTIILHDNFVGVVQLLALYLKNKCKYYLDFERVTNSFDTKTIITLNFEWPNSDNQNIEPNEFDANSNSNQINSNQINNNGVG